MADTVIPDPADPTQALVGWLLLHRIHDSARCTGRPCVIHAPTNHHMRRWTVHWRDDRGMFERICPEHGVGHPDPDQYAFWRETGQEGMGIHGCYCGCCQ